MLAVALGFARYLQRFGWAEFVSTFHTVKAPMGLGLGSGLLLAFVMLHVHRRSAWVFQAMQAALYVCIGVGVWRTGSLFMTGVMVVVVLATLRSTVKTYRAREAQPSV